jgi:hypothetical protein
MSEHTFKNFNEFYDFLATNNSHFTSTKIQSFMGVVHTARKTSCGMCKRKNFNIADETYRNMFTLLTQEDKQMIKSLLNVDSVKFFMNEAPMFTF